MQYIVIVRILAKYRNPSVLSKKKRYLTIYHLSVDLWTIGLSSVSRSKYFETLKGLMSSINVYYFSLLERFKVF